LFLEVDSLVEDAVEEFEPFWLCGAAAPASVKHRNTKAATAHPGPADKRMLL